MFMMLIEYCDTQRDTKPTLRLHSSRFVIESCDVFVGNRTLFEVFGNIQQFENRMKAFDPQCIALGILSTLESSLPFAQKPLLGFNDFFFDRRPVPFGGSRCIETYSSTTSRSRPRTRGESIRS